MEFRHANEDDYPGILHLQAANFVDNLAPEERDEGYVSAEFTLAQLDEMAREGRIVVAVEGGTVLGFACRHNVTIDSHSPLVAEFVRQLNRVPYAGKPLRDQRLFLYGPVVVDRDHRGRGIMRGLYQRLLEDVAGRFDTGVAFVAESNQRSLAAHREGLGMTPVGDFEWDGNRYVILAFRVP